MAQAYQRLGVQITVFAERLLPKEEPEASTTIQRVLEREGVRILQARPQFVERLAGHIHVRFQTENVDADVLFVAAGRAPKLALLTLDAPGRHSHRSWLCRYG